MSFLLKNHQFLLTILKKYWENTELWSPNLIYIVGVSKSDSNILKPIGPIDHAAKKQEQNKYTFSEPEHEAYTKNSLINEISSTNGVKVAADSKCDIGWELDIEHNLQNLVHSKSKNSSVKGYNSEFLGMKTSIKLPPAVDIPKIFKC